MRDIVTIDEPILSQGYYTSYTALDLIFIRHSVSNKILLTRKCLFYNAHTLPFCPPFPHLDWYPLVRLDSFTSLTSRTCLCFLLSFQSLMPVLWLHATERMHHS